jgi:hypothetical protein
MQHRLFDELPKEEKPQKVASLLHLKVEPRKQNEINKKIEKIKTLKETFEKTVVYVQKLKDTYDRIIGTKEQDLIKKKEKFLVKLHQRWKEKGFTNWQTDLMTDIIYNEAEEIRNYQESSEVVDEIIDEIMTSQQAEMTAEDKEYMNDMAKDFFKFSGINMDEDFDFTDDNAFENFQKSQEGFENNRAENEKRDKVLKTDKDFQKLYKRLVKKTHPDLVVDPVEKEKREVLMKELSNAWEQRDYYKLLLLKSDIEVDDDAPISLGKDQTKILINQLNLEIAEWGKKDYGLKHFNPDTSFYYQNFYARHEKTSLKKFEKHKEQLLEQLVIADLHLSMIKTKKSTKDFLKNTRGKFDVEDHFMDGW